MNSRALVVSLLVAAALLLLVGGGTLVSRALSSPDPSSTQKLIIDVNRKQSPREISKILETKGLVSSASDLYWLGRLSGHWSRLKAGEYELSPSMTALQVLRVLTSGISIQHPITVREGENMFEIASDLESKGLASRERFIELCRDSDFMKSLGIESPLPPSLEGYLAPETYFLNKTSSAEEIIRKMVRRALSLWGERESARARELGLTRHQTITLASMIEKETGAPQERPLISSVFHNRLRKKMKLQSDPTTIYGIWETYQGNLRKVDLLQRTDYNTYAIPALPLGPISNPGKEAIQAALYPAQSEFLFFVSHNDGTHEFTKNYEDHNKAVRKFQLDSRAREGKSWRDLKKKTGQPSQPTS